MMPTDNPIGKENFLREHQTYLLDGVSSTACFRQMYDAMVTSLDDKENFLALEWLDTTLAQERYRSDLKSYALIWAVLKAALESCIVLNRHNYVNTGNLKMATEISPLLMFKLF